jgi:hypothetical protein
MGTRFHQQSGLSIHLLFDVLSSACGSIANHTFNKKLAHRLPLDLHFLF